MKQTMGAYQRRLSITGFLFFVPALICLIVFVIIPAVAAAFLSLTSYQLLSSPKFIGLTNYLNILKERDFWDSLRITFSYVIIRVVFILVLSLFIAFVLNKKSKYRSVLQVAFILPYLFPLAATSAIWRVIYRPFGLMESFLSVFGVKPTPWLASSDYALWAILITTIWSGLGYFSVIMLAGVQTLSSEIIEASIVDGASGFQRFFRIIIPMLKPTLFYIIFMSTIGSLQGYSPFLVMTGGGPGTSTRVMGLLIYENGFVQMRMGRACTITVIMLVLIMIITGLQRRILRYEGEK
jgi:ABC-type sugar transport system permease subunit